MKTYRLSIMMMIILVDLPSISAEVKVAPQAWSAPLVSKTVSDNVLYVPIMHELVKCMTIKESGEELVDLLAISNPRIKPLALFDAKYANTYEGYSLVRKSVYDCFMKMLDGLPAHIGIA